MTGFGKSIAEYGNKRINVEIKSLNSKQTDINLKIPYLYREKEIEIRNILSQKLERGKIDCIIFLENNADASNITINKSLALKYYQELNSLATEINETHNDILNILVKMPDVIKAEKEELDENEWNEILKALHDAIDKADKFRKQEGDLLKLDFIKRNNLILQLLSEVEPFEKNRIENIRQRINNDITTFLNSDKIDPNRFEQELIYYIEKIDFTEEKVRLKKHCNYFTETLNEGSAGKKLGFVVQEMGREINTLGSKANDFDIQRIVVIMKDELEKIKEQLSNIL